MDFHPLIPQKKYPDQPFIKICGLTDPDTAFACVRAGADAIGLVFFEKSPRNVSKNMAARITAALPDRILTCGVFVNESFESIMDKKEACSLKAVQLHGNESPDLVSALAQEGLVVIKALFAAKEPGLEAADQYPDASCFLIEYGKGILPGGNAETWNYETATVLKTQTPVILAGGLSPENIGTALTQVHPWGIDVSSGVEQQPGVKDIERVRAFIRQTGRI